MSLERLIEIVSSSFIPILEAGLTVTIPLTLASFLVGIIIAIIVAAARNSTNPILNSLAAFYVWLIRGTPLIVQLYIVYFGLPSVGIVFDPWPAGVFAFSIYFGAFASESIRGAISSVPRGQIEAAESLGMTRLQVFQRTIFPQALRVAIPALMSNLITLFKMTSLASTVTIIDMMLVARRYINIYYETLLIYVEVAILYLFFTTLLTWLQKYVEKRLSVYT